MASEAKRGLVRVASNYVRLFASVAISLALIPILLGVVGDDGVSLILLFGSTVGIAAMFQEIVSRSMVRELGAAYHSGDDRAFQGVYQASLAVAIGAGVLAGLVFAVLWVLVPLFNVEGLETAARWMVFARGVSTVVKVILAPTVNSMMVKERMVSYNLWKTLIQRGHGLIAAVWLLIFPPETMSAGVIQFALISSGCIVLATIAASMIEIIRDRRLVPLFHLVTRADIKNIVHTTGWNSAAIAAMNLYTRADAIIMNAAFLLFGNLTFGLAVLLTNYGRRLANGVTDGLDAVSARLHSGARPEAMRDLVYHTTKLHGLVTFPAALTIAVLAEPLLHLWISKRASDPAAVIPPTVIMIQILMFGIAVRSISDGWARILYGAGKIRSYAPLVVVAGVSNPFLAVALIWVLPSDHWIELMGPVLATSSILTVAHGLIMPRIVARETGMRYGEVIGPLWRPLLVSVIASFVHLGAIWLIDDWTLLWLIAVLACYGVIYVVLTGIFTLTPDERALVRRGLKRFTAGNRRASASE